MKKFSLRMVVVCFLIGPLAAKADEPTRPFQVSLISPAQLYPTEYTIHGVRLNLFYGVNKDVQGLDVGMVNEVKWDFAGVQLGVIANFTRRSCEGLQVAVFYNDTEEEFHGLQIGLVNHVGSLAGIQLGLLNFNDDTKYLGFFPFINAAF